MPLFSPAGRALSWQSDFFGTQLLRNGAWRFRAARGWADGAGSVESARPHDELLTLAPGPDRGAIPPDLRRCSHDDVDRRLYLVQARVPLAESSLRCSAAGLPRRHELAANGLERLATLTSPVDLAPELDVRDRQRPAHASLQASMHLAEQVSPAPRARLPDPALGDGVLEEPAVGAAHADQLTEELVDDVSLELLVVSSRLETALEAGLGIVQIAEERRVARGAGLLGCGDPIDRARSSVSRLRASSMSCRSAPGPRLAGCLHRAPPPAGTPPR